MKYLVLLLVSLFMSTQLFSQKYTIDTLSYQKTDKNIINLVILGDGYTKDELKYYQEDAKRFTDYFFKTEPFRQYANFFNVFAIHTISEESGATHDCNAEDCPKADHGHDNLPLRFNEFPKRIAVPKAHPNTIFGSSFDNFGIHRLVVPQKNDAVEEVVKNHIPNATQVVILVNSPFYGGSGGKYATATVNFDSNDIAVHEIGHSFANLADEYWAGNFYAIEGPNRTQEADESMVPWKHWVGTNGVGVYAYGGKDSRAKWFRPHEFCKMQYLVAPFCNVCQEVFIEIIHKKTNPILTTSFSNTNLIDADSLKTFSLKLLKPSPNTLRVRWYLNDELIAHQIDSIAINKGTLKLGENTLRVEVKDTTELVRNPEHQAHTYTKSWKINSRKNYVLEVPKSTWGDTLETCYNGFQALSIKQPQAGLQFRWYSNQSGGQVISKATNFVTPRMQQNVTYYVEAVWKDKVSSRQPVLIKVLPEIKAPSNIKVVKSKNKKNVTITVNDKLEEGCNYIWLDQNGKPIYQWDEDKGEFIRPEGANNSIVLQRKETKYAVYVQKVDKNTTCVSDKIEVIVD